MVGSDQKPRGGFGGQLSADETGPPQPLRFALFEALQTVAGDCQALQRIDGGPCGKGNVAGLLSIHAANRLGLLWQHWDEAQGILDHIPADAKQDLQSLAGRPWKLATRQTLDEIAKPIQATRPWYEATLHDDQEREAVEQRAMVTAWETADFSTWPALLADLDKLTANLWTIRKERYPAAGDGVRVQPSGSAAQTYWFFFRFKGCPAPADSMHPDMLGDIEIFGDLLMSPNAHEELVKQLYEPSEESDWHVFDLLNDVTESELQLLFECLKRDTPPLTTISSFGRSPILTPVKTQPSTSCCDGT